MPLDEGLRRSLLVARSAISAQQRAWATGKGLKFDANGWLDTSAENLVGSMRRADRDSFAAGAGNELQGKMRALHSSSALAYNMFAPAESDRAFQAAIAELLGIPIGVGSAPAAVRFEVKRPTGWTGTPPHLDVEVGWSCQTAAIESKFNETFEPKTSARELLNPYLNSSPRIERRWRGLEPLFDLATALSNGTRTFSVLDAPQLIKHVLGLWRARSKGDLEAGVTLALVWFDVGEREAKAKPACDALRYEFDAFARAVNPCFDVRSFTHQDLFRAYERHVPEKDARLAWLRARYF